MTRRRKGQRKRSRMLCVCVWNSTICNTLPPLILQLKLIYTYTMCLRVVLMFDLLLLLLLKKKKKKKKYYEEEKKDGVYPPTSFFSSYFVLHTQRIQKKKEEGRLFRSYGVRASGVVVRSAYETKRTQHTPLAATHTHTHKNATDQNNISGVREEKR